MRLEGLVNFLLASASLTTMPEYTFWRWIMCVIAPRYMRLYSRIFGWFGVLCEFNFLGWRMRIKEWMLEICLSVPLPLLRPLRARALCMPNIIQYVA
jgi:hypothetical protein